MFHNRHYVHANDHIKGIDNALSVLPAKDREHTPAVTAARENVDRFKKYPEPFTPYEIAGILAAVPAEELNDKVRELTLDQSGREMVKSARRAGAIDQVESFLEASLLEAQDTYAKRVATTAGKVCADVTEAATGIPADKALNPAAAISEGFVDQHRTILEGLATLTKLAGLYNPSRPKEATKGIGVAMLAEIPATTVTVLSPLHEATLNPDAEQKVNEGVKRLMKDYDDNPTQTLVNIAAGRYPSVTLGIPKDSADLTERRSRLYTATLGRRAKDTENKMIAL